MVRTSSCRQSTPMPSSSPGRTVSPCLGCTLTPAPRSGRSRGAARRIFGQKVRAVAHTLGPRTIAWAVRSLGGGDVLRLHPLLALRRLVGDLGTLFKRPKPTARYPGVVHEEVFATIVRGDKAVALLVVEPLNRSLGHVPSPPFSSLGRINESATQAQRAAFHDRNPPSTAPAVYKNGGGKSATPLAPEVGDSDSASAGSS